MSHIQSKDTLSKQIQNAGNWFFGLSIFNLILTPILYTLDDTGADTALYIVIEILLILPMFFTSLYLRTDMLEDIKKTKTKMLILLYYSIFFFILAILGGGFPWLFIIAMVELNKARKLFNKSFELKAVEEPTEA